MRAIGQSFLFWGSLLAFFLLLPPGILDYICPVLSNGIKLSTIVVLCVEAIWCRHLKIRLSRAIAGFFAIVAGYFGFIFIGGVYFGVEGISLSPMLAFCRLLSFALMAMIAKKLEVFGRWLNLLKHYCWVLLIANLFSQLLFPQGIMTPHATEEISWQPLYFLCNSNYFVFYYIFFVAIATCESFYVGKKISASVLVMLVLEVFSYVLCGAYYMSATGIILVVLMLLIVLFERFTGLLGCLTHELIAPCLIVFILAVVVFSGHGHFLGVPFELLGINSDTLLSRVDLWSDALASASDSPIIGHGSFLAEFSEENGHAKTSHNNYVQILYYGGIVALAFFVAVVLYSFANIKSGKHILRSIQYLRVFLVLYLIIFFVEQNPFCMLFFYLLFLSVYMQEEGCLKPSGRQLDKRTDAWACILQSSLKAVS